MIDRTATAQAHPNIAFIKYWGNQDDQLRIPENSSLSMNLDGLTTITKVTWVADTPDQLTLNGRPEHGGALTRVSQHLDAIRQRLSLKDGALVVSDNNFPMGTGIASSASSFAALTLAAFAAAKVPLDERELSTYARLGSGSASRSVPAGFVRWHMGRDHASSYAESIAPADHWDLVDVVAIISANHKAVGSQDGHRSARTSPLQAARVAGAAERVERCQTALLGRDFTAFAQVVEEDSNLMHAIMMTSRPALFYWQPQTLAIMEAVTQWRNEGINVCYTLDAGPNVHCICIRDHASVVTERLQNLSIQVRTANVGGPAQVLSA
jgi:diphosphomevalonate decarboxylase